MATRIKYVGSSSTLIRVLGVEDSPGDQRLVSEMLEEAKLGRYELRGANTLSVAFRLLYEERFDVVLLDLNLPDSNGIETFLLLHNKFPKIPIIVLTGGTDDEPAMRAINEGAQDYLFKDELTSRALSHSILYAIERKLIEEDLHQAIQAREESHRTLSAIMEFVPESITITGGPPDFPIKIVSSYTLRTTGRPYEKLTGVPAGKHQKAWGLTLPDGTTPEPDMMPLYRAAHFGEETKNFELLMHTADGKELTIIDSAAPIRDNDGHIVAAINVWRDVSDMKEAERELDDSKSRAELYLDLLTHDIINYNTVVMGYLQLAETRLKLDEKDKKLIIRPLQELRNSSEIIANIRDLKSIQEGRVKIGPIDICYFLNEIKGEYEDPPGREIKILVDSIDDCMVKGSSLLRDVFANIVSNSINHSTGPLMIKVSVRKGAQNGKNYVKVSVDDNGPGITDDVKVKLFSRPSRGLTKGVGHGLGLFLVKRLVEDHDGKVWVEDRIEG